MSRLLATDSKVAGVLVLLWLTPFVAAAMVLTMSIYGAFLGLPLLLLVGPPAWWEISRMRGDQRGSWSRLVWAPVAIVATLTGSVIGSIAGANDLSTGLESIIGLIIVAWLLIGMGALFGSLARLAHAGHRRRRAGLGGAT